MSKKIQLLISFNNITFFQVQETQDNDFNIMMLLNVIRYIKYNNRILLYVFSIQPCVVTWDITWQLYICYCCSAQHGSRDLRVVVVVGAVWDSGKLDGLVSIYLLYIRSCSHTLTQ